jgi:hypothetical protein
MKYDGEPDAATSDAAIPDAAIPDAAMADFATPEFSVVVPARDCASVLTDTLCALRASEVQPRRWELIVVDDASGDSSADVAASFADAVVRVRPGPRGPAFARNLGAARARGRYVVFVDSDVRVHPDALEQLVRELDSRDGPAAVFGAYDSCPPERGLVSQYRNLLHHYVHWTNPGPADTFWAGLGAIRRDVFLRIGMFDEQRFTRPQIEDIELGYRLSGHGYRIVLCPEIQGTHLKRWTLAQMVRTDLLDRAVPWMELLLERRHAAREGTLNIKQSERALTLMTAAGFVLAITGLATGWLSLLLLGAGCLVAVVAANSRLLSWFARERGIAFATAVIPLRLLFYLVSGAGAAWAVLLYALPGRRGDVSLHGVTS